MKKFNKFLSVAVASAMVMAMAGCGNTDNGSAATGTSISFGKAVNSDAHPAAAAIFAPSSRMSSGCSRPQNTDKIISRNSGIFSCGIFSTHPSISRMLLAKFVPLSTPVQTSTVISASPRLYGRRMFSVPSGLLGSVMSINSAIYALLFP